MQFLGGETGCLGGCCVLRLVGGFVTFCSSILVVVGFSGASMVVST